MKNLIFAFFLISLNTFSNSSCETKSDCTLIKMDCCDCNHGGRLKAVSLSQAKKIKTQNIAKCTDKACLAIISDHWSCLRGMSDCIQNECKLIDPQANKKILKIPTH